MPETKLCPLCGRTAVLASTGAAIQADVPGGGGAVLGYAGKMLCKNFDGHPGAEPWSEPAGMIATDEHRARSVDIERQQRIAARVRQVKQQLSPTDYAAFQAALGATSADLSAGAEWTDARFAGFFGASAVVRQAMRLTLAICDLNRGRTQHSPEAVAAALRFA